ncbi:hypothetical protein N9Q05_02055 [bacterium]|nr:hypothetical protein [bacterium]
MVRGIKENRYIIRKYLRTLSVSKNVVAYLRNDTDTAIKFFIILHNMLMLEEEFYDQFMMSNREINKYLHLDRSWTVDYILGQFYKLHDRKGLVRKNVETVSKIEEVKYILKDNPNLYKKLKI